MKTLAIIPARAGSERLPGKNLAQINGKSLVAIAVDCALEAGIDITVVSTDSREIWDAAVTGRMLPPSRIQSLLVHDRPADLATGVASSLAVVREAIASLDDSYRDFDVTVLLQPTSPLRTSTDVRGCLAALGNGDAAVSLTEPRHADWLYQLGHANRLREGVPGRDLYMPNGAVFVLTREALKDGLDWWPPSITYGYVMPRERSIDIDTQADLDEARRLAAVAA